MKALITAGGLGSRISKTGFDIPKSMIEISGKPMIQYQIESLKKQGFNEIIITVGYLADEIINYFQDGKNLNVKISYYREENPLGTAGAILYLKDQLTDDFILFDGDLIYDIDINAYIKKHSQYKKKYDALASIITHSNDHPFDSSVIEADENGRVVKWHNREDNRDGVLDNNVNSGIHILSKSLFDNFKRGIKLDLDREILKPLVKTGKLFSYRTEEYIREIGIPERIKIAENDLKIGKIKE